MTTHTVVRGSADAAYEELCPGKGGGGQTRAQPTAPRGCEQRARTRPRLRDATCAPRLPSAVASPRGAVLSVHGCTPDHGGSDRFQRLGAPAQRQPPSCAAAGSEIGADTAVAGTACASGLSSQFTPSQLRCIIARAPRLGVRLTCVRPRADCDPPPGPGWKRVRATLQHCVVLLFRGAHSDLPAGVLPRRRARTP